MFMRCEDCGAEFTEMEQTNSEYKAGQCPECHGEDLKEEDNGEDSGS